MSGSLRSMFGLNRAHSTRCSARRHAFFFFWPFGELVPPRKCYFSRAVFAPGGNSQGKIAKKGHQTVSLPATIWRDRRAIRSARARLNLAHERMSSAEILPSHPHRRACWFLQRERRFILGECYPEKGSKRRIAGADRIAVGSRGSEREARWERRSAEIMTRNGLRMRRVQERFVWEQILRANWHGPCSSGERE